MSTKVHGLARVARRTLVELFLALAGIAIYGEQLSAGERRNALLALFAGALGALSGLIALHRSGALLVALHCPRLDALGFHAGSRSAPWPTLRAADDALRALDGDGARYRDFFPEARRDLIAAAFRALEAHRLRVRAERALAATGASGNAAGRLRAQAERANAELLALTRTLRDLRARLIASTAPQHAMPDALPSLRALEERSDALAQAHGDATLPPGESENALARVHGEGSDATTHAERSRDAHARGAQPIRLEVAP